MPGAKKLTCLDCDKEFDPEATDGVCPNCDLNMRAILEKDRHERALAKLREQQKKGDKKKAPFGF